MARQVLITGGAGFIGSHLADLLLARGYRVRALDALEPQVHGEGQRRPEYLAPEVELQVGDVRDPDAVRRALDGVDAVYHFAARVGVGQSMYQCADYMAQNTVGTAVLMEQLAERRPQRLVVASSMSLYGEGLYRDAAVRFHENAGRSEQQLREDRWEVYGEQGNELEPLPTPESKRPSLSSVYALSKYDQEQMALIMGRAYGIPTTALRFFNVYGSRQALSNPYTGVLAIFASRLLNRSPPLVYEDGEQRRDFVHVSDVARACLLAMERPEAVGRVFNVGSGQVYTVREIARRMAAALGVDIEPEITGRYRAGDIRNCFADISRARELLGFTPQVALEDGLAALTEWLADQQAVDRSAQAVQELQSRGLTV